MIGFWIAAALLTAIVVTLLGWPLMRKAASTDLGGGTDLAVYRDQLAELEREAILGAIRTLNGDKLQAARLLGIGKTTLYRKLKEYGIVDPLHEDI